MSDTNLSIDDLIFKLQQMKSAGHITGSETLLWKHREWGHVAICDVEKTSEEFEFGSVACLVLKPAAFVPQELAEDWAELRIHFVPSDKKIPAIKALRTIQEGMGLAQAKLAIESITPTTPYCMKRVNSDKLRQWRELLLREVPSIVISSSDEDGDLKTMEPPSVSTRVITIESCDSWNKIAGVKILRMIFTECGVRDLSLTEAIQIVQGIIDGNAQSFIVSETYYQKALQILKGSVFGFKVEN